VYGAIVSLSERAARALEAGRWDGAVTRAVASMLAPFAARGVVRPASVPLDVGVVSVGGATLGGSGKTRLAIACARALASMVRGRVVLVGHAYRARPGGARVVSPDDSLAEVGDEALVAARALAPAGVSVVVAPSRQAAIDRALAATPRPSVLVIDGALRLRDRRDNALSLLAVDAARPWGSGRLPPAGDLRAPRARLLAEADLVVPVDAAPLEVRWTGDERRAPIASLAQASFGLFTAVARPDRLVRALADLGVRPAAVVSATDHGPPSERAARALRSARVDAWVGTSKCVLHLEPLLLARPVGALLGSLELARALAPPLARALGAFAERSASGTYMACLTDRTSEQ
jgi:tetraacyldisaccharide 4'-kinase